MSNIIESIDRAIAALMEYENACQLANLDAGKADLYDDSDAREMVRKLTRQKCQLRKIARNEPNVFLGIYKTFNEVVIAAYDFVEAVLEEDSNDYDAHGIARRFGKQLDNGLWLFDPDEEDAEVLRIIDTEYFIA